MIDYAREAYDELMKVAMGKRLNSLDSRPLFHRIHDSGVGIIVHSYDLNRSLITFFTLSRVRKVILEHDWLPGLVLAAVEAEDLLDEKKTATLHFKRPGLNEAIRTCVIPGTWE